MLQRPRPPGPLPCRNLPRRSLPVDKFVEFFWKAAGKALYFPLVSYRPILIHGLTRSISIGKWSTCRESRGDLSVVLKIARQAPFHNLS